VRVEAGRLRTRLEEYYAREGAASGLRIGLPKGGYVAQFKAASPPDLEPSPLQNLETSKPPEARRSTRSWLLAGAAVVIAGLSLWLLAWRGHPERPSIAVLRFTEYSGDGALARLAAQLNDDVTSEMARLGTVSVVSHTSVMQFAGTSKPLREIAEALDADFVMEATVEPEPGGIRVVARLVSARTNRKVWVQDFHGRTDAVHDLSRRMAAGAAAEMIRIQPAR
jgi:TolB-like protein